MKLAEVPVDDKNRPITPIVIASCGELELRKRKEQGEGFKQPTSGTISDFLGNEELSTSRTENVKTKQHKKRKRRELTPEGLETSPAHLDKKETEEEYDARLEREEAERREQERKQILLDIKKTFSEESKPTGVRYKGKYNTQCLGTFYL